jgi:hypothetical protein
MGEIFISFFLNFLHFAVQDPDQLEALEQLFPPSLSMAAASNAHSMHIELSLLENHHDWASALQQYDALAATSMFGKAATDSQHQLDAHQHQHQHLHQHQSTLSVEAGLVQALQRMECHHLLGVLAAQQDVASSRHVQPDVLMESAWRACRWCVTFTWYTCCVP